MLRASGSNNPIVLSYLALRRAVGWVALALPFVLAIPWWFVHNHHAIQSSISAYYYTGMRNLFVGSLCAISMFMLSCRGYDLRDEVAGLFSAFCSLGVAFFPTSPECPETKLQGGIGTVHYIFAALLFMTLAYFCLVLFKMTADPNAMTPKKRQRNAVYTICGYAILTSVALAGISKIPSVQHRIECLKPVFYLETIALFAFGVAWLAKGEMFLKDEHPQPRATQTTDNILLPTHPRARADE